MLESQDPKYTVDAAGRIVNRQSGVAIPADEPVMLFRAHDANAAPTIAYYLKLCTNPYHQDVVKGRLNAFIDFMHAHPERMKEPDTDNIQTSRVLITNKTVPKASMLAAFCLGIMFCAALYAGIQAYVGKSTFTLWVTQHWVELPWQIFALQGLVALSLLGVLMTVRRGR